MKIRCSALGAFMTTGRSKSEPFGQTAKSLIRDIQIAEKYGRRQVFANKYMTKGNVNEAQAVDLLNRVRGTEYILQPLYYQNDHIHGTPDIVQDGLVIDIKNSFDIWSFDKAEVTKDYYWQLQGYMALTGATKAALVYCLTSAPEWMIEGEKRKIYYGLGGENADMEAYAKAVEQIQINMTFEDIPEAERVKWFDVERNNEDIQSLYERVELARELFT